MIKELYEFYWKWWKIPLHPDFVTKLLTAHAQKQNEWAWLLGKELTRDIQLADVPAGETPTYHTHLQCDGAIDKWLMERTKGIVNAPLLKDMICYTGRGTLNVKENRFGKDYTGTYQLCPGIMRKQAPRKDTKLTTILTEMWAMTYWNKGHPEYSDIITTAFSQLRDALTGGMDNKAILRISIDPIDLLGCSLGTSGWTSCYRVDSAFGGGGTCNVFNPQAGIALVHRSLEPHKESGRPEKYYRRWLLSQEQQLLMYHSFPSENANKIMADAIAGILGGYVASTCRDGETKIESHHGSYQDALANKVLPKGVALLQKGWHFGQDVYPCPVCGMDRHLEQERNEGNYARTPLCKECRGKQYTQEDFDKALRAGEEVAPVRIEAVPEITKEEVRSVA